MFKTGEQTSDDEQIAPHFIKQPKAHIFFLNSSGVMIDCEVTGKPKPKITWILNRDTKTPVSAF